MLLSDALAKRRTAREFSDRSVGLPVVRRLLWAAEGITDGKGLRTAPSAHGLHPLRLHLVAGRIDDLEPGLHVATAGAGTLTRYAGGDRRADLVAAALGEQPWIGDAAGAIAVCADFATPTRDFADQPPAGSRGPRYVFIEAGAVAQNMALQAAAEGLASVLVAGFRDEAVARALDLAPPVQPVLLLCFGWPRE